MLHTIEDLIEKINAMHNVALQLHRERNRYSAISGLEYDHSLCTHLVEQIQSMALEIANDKQGKEIKTRMEYKNGNV